MASNGYNFTERIRKVLAMAREESRAMHHEYVGTEHLLLGLLGEGEGVACAVIQALGADMDEIRKSVLQQLGQGTYSELTGPDVPYTSRAKKVLELSMVEARDMNHSYVGTEHLLLGLLSEKQGIAAQVLTNHGLTVSSVRAETLRMLDVPDVAAVSEPFPGRPLSPPSKREMSGIVKVFVEMHLDDGTVQRKEFANAAWAIKYLESR